MKFAKITFYIAFIWGVLVLTPLYFMFDMIGRQDPPPITHPGFYYGFIGAGLAWQVAFLYIARDPVRFRPMMVPSALEKLSFMSAMAILYSRNRIHTSDLGLAVIDGLFGLLFVAAFFFTSRASRDN